MFASESAAGSFIRDRIAKGTTVHADESGAWGSLHDRFEAACVVPRLAFTITLLARICFAMRRKSHGGKIIAASRMAIR